MKIGVITFWETSDNYGQILQGYALQTYLRSMGHDVFIIRYDHDGKYRRPIWYKKKCISKILKLLMVYPAIYHLIHRKKNVAIKQRLAYNAQQNKLRKFDDFRNTYFQFSGLLYLTLKELQQNPPKADLYIAGSDQIWGWSLKKYDNRAFFLDFGSNFVKRVAYAPSFAMEHYPDRYKSKLVSLLKRFEAISVREITGVSICKSVAIDAKWVCDPTMLLARRDYEQLIRKRQNSSFIFIYSININQKEEMYWDEIREVADEKGLSIKVTTSSGHIPANELFEDVVYDYSTVEGWLSNIYNSEFVVTTSFHGVSLSILLNKKFAFIPLHGEYAKGNNRVFDLLNLLSLKKQIADSKNCIKRIYMEDIDWKDVNQRLDLFRKVSQDYLINSIK